MSALMYPLNGIVIVVWGLCHLGYAQKVDVVTDDSKSVEATLLFQCGNAELIILQEFSNGEVVWKKTGPDGELTNQGTVKTKKDLSSFFDSVKGSLRSDKDKNPGMPTGQYSMVLIDSSHKVSIVGKLSIAQQQTAALDELLIPLGNLRYIEPNGGGTGAFHPMLKRFRGPLAWAPIEKKKGSVPTDDK